MNLTETYNSIYVVCKTYNDLIAKEQWEREHFADLEDYLQKNRNDIVKYELVAEISKKFRNNEFNIEDIKNLIQKKRQEEKNRLQREKTFKKWGAIIAAIVCTVIILHRTDTMWILLILIAIFVFILIKFPEFRTKIGDGINKDWKIVTNK
ncbi:MAG: hypothetical protein IJM33_01375 [Bacteroidales bacterium]|nr:hypothetical protein [Bacteroidales bacterium]